MKTLVVVYVALLVLALSACQKSNGNDQATAPGISAECVNNPSLCQSNIYTTTPGYTPYNYGYNNGSVYGGGSYYSGGYYSGYYSGYNVNPFQNYNNASYLCNCPTGSVPTYNSYAGLGCVQTSQIYASASAYAYFGWSAGSVGNNSQWTNMPQISNYAGYSQSSCYNGVVQSCLVGQSSTCYTGFSCVANSATSRIGLCVATNALNGGYGGIVAH